MSPTHTCEIFKKAETLEPKMIFNVTILDAVRSSTINALVQTLIKPIVGGQFGVIQVINQCNALKALTDRIQNASTEVVKSKSSPSLIKCIHCHDCAWSEPTTSSMLSPKITLFNDEIFYAGNECCSSETGEIFFTFSIHSN